RRRQVAHRAGVCRGNDVGAYIRPSVAQSADFLDLIAPAGLGVKDDLRGRVDLDVVGAAAQGAAIGIDYPSGDGLGRRVRIEAQGIVKPVGKTVGCDGIGSAGRVGNRGEV